MIAFTVAAIAPSPCVSFHWFTPWVAFAWVSGAAQFVVGAKFVYARRGIWDWLRLATGAALLACCGFLVVIDGRFPCYWPMGVGYVTLLAAAVFSAVMVYLVTDFLDYAIVPHPAADRARDEAPGAPSRGETRPDGGCHPAKDPAWSSASSRRRRRPR